MHEQKGEESRSRKLERRKNDGTDEAFALAEERCRMESEICYLVLFDDSDLLHSSPCHSIQSLFNKYRIVSHH